MSAVRFEHISKSFETEDGVVEALMGLTLDIESGEFLALVGESGCGKSTALRIAAGFEKQDHGNVILDGINVNRLETHERNLGMVTQLNALVRHRSVKRNISLPLEFAAENPADVEARVQAEADQFTIGHLLRRSKGQLSGGETQAVQLARALIARPKLLLLDEPLARIDRDLRNKLRGDLSRVQREYGLTTLLVTADQADAMTLADRVAVLERGRLQQVGPPMDLYERPINATVARFLGEPAMNLLRGPVRDEGAIRTFGLGGTSFPLHAPVTQRFVGNDVVVGLRPEDIPMASAGAVDDRHVRGTVASFEPRGSSNVVTVALDRPTGPTTEIVVVTSGFPPKLRDAVGLRIDPARFHLFDPYTEAALHHPV